MTNERLVTSMVRSGMTIETAAHVAGVDPKTVDRWRGGRTPHPRHRFALADALDESEEFLWPNANRNHGSDQAAAELVTAYPYRADVDPSRWWDLITKAERQIDLLGYTLYFLPHQHPQLIETLLEKCAAGCKIRLVLADPDSEHVRRRDDEEDEAITLVARITSSTKAFDPLRGCPGAEMRFQDAPLYNSIFRFDDQMFVTPHLYATPGRAAPLMHLARLGPNGMFSRFAAHFEGLWADCKPVRHDQSKKPVRSGV
jgi:hypothetical protein